MDIKLPITKTQINNIVENGYNQQVPGILVIKPEKTDSATCTTSPVPRSHKLVHKATQCRDHSLTATPADLSNNLKQSNLPNQEVHLANIKEKTPMCLINELARHNKIQHLYTLTDEQGPAHKKIFFMKLKLGTEEYFASGASIKKAQHAAAQQALEKTSFRRPPQRSNHNPNINILTPVAIALTPTVELNALAMKRGESTVYKVLEPQRSPYHIAPSLDFRGMYQQRYHFAPPPPRPFYVSLKVGQHEFIGEGHTRQAARHNSAAKALQFMKSMPIPETAKSSTPQESETAKTTTEEKNTDDELKSEISLVHELALKRNLAVIFEVVRESGPPHMRTFITLCKVGEFSTEGDGNSKKLSKKRAAYKMLDKLHSLPPLPSDAMVHRQKRPIMKKKNKNLIKLQKTSIDYGDGINPISRLIQIQQAKKEHEPIYTYEPTPLVTKKREFILKVQVNDQVCYGKGPNKKLAKRNAAEEMLFRLGYSRPPPQPTKSAIKSSDGQASSSSSDKKVKFLDQDRYQSRQLAPGLLLMPYSALQPQQGSKDKTLNDTSKIQTNEHFQTNERKMESNNSNVSSEVTSSTLMRPKQQLLYLAKLLSFQVQFTDFPKGANKSEFLSLVSLSTNPPQVSHGSGATIEESHDMASLVALESLVNQGFDIKQIPSNSPEKSTSNKLSCSDQILTSTNESKHTSPANSSD